MATGDIKSVSIESNGWNALITVEGVNTGGTYAFGFGTNNNPSTAKIAFNLTSPGYDSSGNVTTIARTVYGTQCERPTATGAMRKVYPNQAQPDETVSGSDVVIRVALSDFVYSGDTSITANFGAGWYTQGGTPNNAATGAAVTNNSTLGYPKVLGGWAVRNAQLLTGASPSLLLEFVAFHKFAQQGKTVQAVKFTVTDGTTTLTQWSTAMGVFPDSPNGKIVGYRSTFDLSTLADNAVVTANAVCYPWVGDATAVLDTNDGVNAFPSPAYAPWKGRMDKAEDHGHILVDPVGGNDTTGTVYSTRAAAEAGSACLTVGSAFSKLQAYHNINSGHNTSGGGTVYLKEATYDFNASTGGNSVIYTRITPATGAAKANVIIRPGASNAGLQRMSWFDGVTFNNGTTATWTFNSNSEAAACFCTTNCAFNTTITNNITYTVAKTETINCTGQYGGAGIKILQAGLIRGNTFTNDTQGVAHVMIGNKNISPSYYPAAASTQKYNDGGVCAFNEYGALRTAQSTAFANDRNVLIGFALVQNLILRYTSSVEPLVGIGMDSSTATSTNIVIHNNTIAGQRCNFGYNDTSGATHLHTNWSVKNNIFNYNNKDDTFGSSANGIGAWPVGYAVGHSGNHYRRPADDEWLGEFQGVYMVRGTSATPLAPGYVNDGSLDGTNLGGGDYHLTSAAPAKALTHDVVMPYDFEGLARTLTNADAPGVYRYYVQTSGKGQTWPGTGTVWKTGGPWFSSIWNN